MSISIISSNKPSSTTTTIYRRLRQEMEIYRLKKQLLYSYKEVEKLQQEKADSELLREQEKQQSNLQVNSLSIEKLDSIAQDLGFPSFEAVSMSDVATVKETNSGGIVNHVH